MVLDVLLQCSAVYCFLLCIRLLLLLICNQQYNGNVGLSHHTSIIILPFLQMVPFLRADHILYKHNQNSFDISDNKIN